MTSALFLALLLFGVFPASAHAVTWEGLRDGVVWVRIPENGQGAASPRLECRWREAWAADGHRESLWFQDSRGGLVERLKIDFAQTSGAHGFAADRGPGDYRLEVPGLSYRYYDLRVPDELASIFEPVKVHFSLRVNAGTTFYFRVPDRAAFTLGGKFHDGPDRIEVESSDGSKAGALELKSHKKYSRFDTLAFEEAPGGVWKIRFPGSGKVSFWLDGIDNLFALRPQDLFIPERRPGTVEAVVEDRVMGRAPLLGTMLEFADLPPKAFERLAAMGLRSANHYAFQEPLEKRPDGDASWLRAYRDRMSLTDSLTIFDRTTGPKGTDPVGYGRFIRSYLERHGRASGAQTPRIAFFDEPNLIFKDEAAFLDAHRRLAEDLKRSGRAELAEPSIAAPESSGLVNGPTTADSRARRGADWLRSLLNTQGDMIDAVSWHEWMVRDLVSTPWYAESVEEAARLDAAAPRKGRPEGRELIISQTSISSGPDVSPYEHDAFFAGLWWASVVARAGATGKLAVLDWFKSVDDPERYDKGLLKFGGDWAEKPVGRAMRFIAPAMLPEVLAARCDSVETDVLAMTGRWPDRASGKAPGPPPGKPSAASRGREDDPISVLLVNKFPRTNHIRLTLSLPSALKNRPLRWTLASLSEIAGSLDERRETGMHPPGPTLIFERNLTGETIYSLRIEPIGSTGPIGPAGQPEPNDRP